MRPWHVPPSGASPGPGLTPLDVLLTVPDPPDGDAPPSLRLGPRRARFRRSGVAPPCLRPIHRSPEGSRPDLVVSLSSPFSEEPDPPASGLHPTRRSGIPEPLLRLRQEASCEANGANARGWREIPRGFLETHRLSPTRPLFSTVSTTRKVNHKERQPHRRRGRPATRKVCCTHIARTCFTPTVQTAKARSVPPALIRS